ncbi:hypothetical protein CIB84_001406 [Bambusicola thoracicus]|uniref:Uncharacterized protein n=1 Tax=Bambusicola thoracicus TaxID=9083 RepID=A0A2P4TEQ0_BAMTH|nr:hypothetical protein CIB84_001406 [Bambusicola thoracicus]
MGHFTEPMFYRRVAWRHQQRSADPTSPWAVCATA